MGSISNLDYTELHREFGKNYHKIILMNKNPILEAIQDYQRSGYPQWVRLRIPKSIPYFHAFHLSINDKECCIVCLHYQMKVWKTFREFDREFKRHFHGTSLRMRRFGKTHP